MSRLRNGSKADSNPGYLDCESGFLPLSHRGPLYILEISVSLLSYFDLYATLYSNVWVLLYFRKCSPANDDEL